MRIAKWVEVLRGSVQFWCSESTVGFVGGQVRHENTYGTEYSNIISLPGLHLVAPGLEQQVTSLT